MKATFESFARFFEEPTREGLRELLRTNFGEQDNLDFKGDWPELPKMAKHVLAFANSGGGCIIIGVSELDDKSLSPKGLESLKDKSDISKGFKSFIPSDIKYEILDFAFDAAEYQKLVGLKFQVLLIDDNPEYIPFISKSSGDGIKQNALYVRRGTNSEEANYEEIQKVINRRIETGYSSTTELKLEEHIAQLKVLYGNIPKYNVTVRNILENFSSAMYDRIFKTEKKTANPFYPDEDFDQFIGRMIELKQSRIETLIMR